MEVGLAEDGERERDGVADGGGGRGQHLRLDLPAEAIDQLRLPARVEALLPGELSVVVRRRVEGNVGVGDQVGDRRAPPEDPRQVSGAECRHEVPVVLGDPVKELFGFRV